jgi:hypothetical protein
MQATTAMREAGATATRLIAFHRIAQPMDAGVLKSTATGQRVFSVFLS